MSEDGAANAVVDDVAGDGAELEASEAPAAEDGAVAGGEERGEPSEEGVEGVSRGSASPTQDVAGDVEAPDSGDFAAEVGQVDGSDEQGESQKGATSPAPDETLLPEGGVDSAMIPDGDDGLGDGDDGDINGDEEVEEEEPEEDKPDPLQELQEKFEQLWELNDRAMQANVTLQRRVIQKRMQDKSYDADKPSEGKVTEHKYQNLLHDVRSVRLQLRLQHVKAARMSEELKKELDAKRQKAIVCRDSFQAFKRQVALHAEYSRTGKKIPEKIIQEIEEFELDKDGEVEEVRGSNISLKNRLAKLEQALRKKDELAENLHVIDFEQLKIENQTSNEKIDERNEELHKLRKKTINTVQIITHMREKVQFVQQEYQALKTELQQLDQDLASQRDHVARTKHERDEHRLDHGRLRQQTDIINSEHLTQDFENRAQNIKQLQQEIENMKKRHAQMTQFLKKHGGSV